MLSASAASFGTISIGAMFFVSLGAITLALLFGRLATRSPSTGGPYTYARESCGGLLGFLSIWFY
ncbi:hypothetical protein [Streptomyces cyaneofuscatus]|uniref:hypothetical protein n=1 Tax=Streptomyces cyaneofuscatus TaxID=66883 RepID=UPI00365A0382